MTSVASPHGLAVAGALFMLGGLAILGAAVLNRAMLAPLKSSFDTPAKLGVAASFAVPFVAFGLFLQAAGNMVDVAIGPGLTALLLALAFGLLLFVLLDETIADSMERKSVKPAADPEQPLSTAVRDAISDVTRATEVPKIALVS